MRERTIYALGFFDGVHLGHQALLLACRHLANRTGCKSGVVTFTSHPDALVLGKSPALVNTVEDRERLLRGYGIEAIAALPFDNGLMTTHWSRFLQQLVDGGAAGFVCGSDFRFGAGGSGTAKKLEGFCKKRLLPYAIVPQQELDGILVSSTYIRTLLEQGDIKGANRFLGHPHILTGRVVAGRQLGRTIGIPTANLALPEELQSLRFGVYACRVQVEGADYMAVTNVGTRPTVEGDSVTVEAFLLDFDGDLYGKTVTVAFYDYLREEKKFPCLADLQEEILKNVRQTREFFEKS